MRLAPALVTTAALAAAACGSGKSGGVPTVNLYYARTEPGEGRRRLQRAGAAPVPHLVPGTASRSRRPADPHGSPARRAGRRHGRARPGRDLDPDFASAGWILEWTGERKAEAEKGTLAAPLEPSRYRDKLYAAPKNTNTQLLWYRNDLVERPPRTSDEMITKAQLA
jgi:multiple sugar transport system substrate-binding protein